MNVELIYVDANNQIKQYQLQLQEGAKVLDAINASGLYDNYPETKNLTLGIYSKPATLNTLVKAGDRIEVYRPLLLDPKEKRRHRAKQR